MTIHTDPIPNAFFICGSASQQRPHLAAQIDQIESMPGIRVYQVIGANRLSLSDRRFLVKLVKILDHEGWV